MRPLFLLPLFALPLTASAADFNADFNLLTNPGTTGWTYGYTTSLGSSLITHSTLVDNGTTQIWDTPALSGDNTPSVFKRYGAPGDGVASGEAGLHGGPSGEFAVARYTFGNAGTYSIAGAFGQGDIGAVDLYVRRGATNLFSVLGTSSTQGFNLSGLSFVAGESVDFVVGIAGDYRFDSTPLSATITPVPEPASFAALGLGALGLLRRRRK